MASACADPAHALITRGVVLQSPTPFSRLQGTNSLVIGLPDCGNVCKTKHLPGFVDRMQELVDAGFPSVVVASVTTPEKLQGFLEDAGAVACGIKGLADTSGGFTRMLGLEINNPGTTPPYSQRYVAFVQDGTLVRLVRSPRCASRGLFAVGCTCTDAPFP